MKATSNMKCSRTAIRRFYDSINVSGKEADGSYRIERKMGSWEGEKMGAKVNPKPPPLPTRSNDIHESNGSFDEISTKGSYPLRWTRFDIGPFNRSLTSLPRSTTLTRYWLERRTGRNANSTRVWQWAFKPSEFNLDLGPIAAYV